MEIELAAGKEGRKWRRLGEGRGGEEKRKTLAEDAYEINEYFLISCAWLVPGRKEESQKAIVIELVMDLSSLLSFFFISKFITGTIIAIPHR